jgi:hypothetical protein
MKLISDVSDCGSKKWDLAESAFGESLESGGRLCVGAFGSYQLP